MTQQAGWYPDPSGAGERWHDGRRWTGVTRLDPLTARATAHAEARRERRQRRPRRLHPFLVGTVVLCAVLAANVLVRHVSDSAGTVAARLGLTSHQRLLPKVSSAGSVNYTILNTDHAGQPVTYDPCQPIEYVINPAGAPSDYMSFVSPQSRRPSARRG